MYLKALEIQGFKSFPDKTVLTFGSDITAIVGPNGSGKSNVADAIRWVMGEQSTKELRGGKMEDVIFGGTPKRPQVGYAQVSLIIDNAAHILPLDEIEVMVTRRYYRSGESEFYINRRSVRLRDIQELFMDTGMGREGYSVIGQGRIDEILSTKSEDRREVFESAAGIARFRKRKEEAERKIAATDGNLTRINDKIAELELQVEPLRDQSEKAKKYLVLRDELRLNEVSLWMTNLDKLRADSGKLRADAESARIELENKRQAQQQLYARSEELVEQSRGRDLELERVRGELSAAESREAELESAAAVLRTNIENNLENLRRLQEDDSRQSGREQAVLDRAGEYARRAEEIDAARAALKEQSAQLIARAGEAAEQSGRLEQALEVLRAQAGVAHGQREQANVRLSALRAAAEEMRKSADSTGEDRRLAAERLTRAEAEQAAAQAAYGEAGAKQTELDNVIRGYTLRCESRTQKCAQQEKTAEALRSERGGMAQRVALLAEMEKDYEGFSRAVKTVMQESARGELRGVHGPLANLIRTGRDYTIAIEIALGAAAQNIVVETEGDAKAAINSLKRRDAGRATFLPLSVIQGRRMTEDLSRQPGYVGVAADLVQCDARYNEIVGSYLGRTVVADNMDHAIAMARASGHRFRIVTLDGQILNAGGSMTGGSVGKNVGILSRAEELKRLRTELAALEQRLSQAESQLDEARRQRDAAAFELDTAREEKRRWDDQMLVAEAELRRTGERLEAAQDEAAELNASAETLAQRLTENGAAITAAERESEQYRLEAERLEAELAEQSRGREQLRVQTGELTGQLAELATQDAALKAEAEAARRSITEQEQLLQELRMSGEDRRRAAEERSAQDAALRDQLAQTEQHLQTVSADCDARREAVRAVSAERMELEAERTRGDKTLQELNGALMELERECARLEQKTVSADLEEKTLIDKLWDSYELNYTTAQEVRVPVESLAKTRTSINELRRKISALGTPNLGAIEEFERVNGRYTFLTGERDDVLTARGELEQIIADITGQMQSIFSEQFAQINLHFNETFVEMFGGGKASLELGEGDDILSCDIDIKAQPPGKSLKTISLLSGGEKAFAAIALYFAMLKVRPTPFCMIDEIDAALDAANVVRFADYMRRMSDKTQFIVITHRRSTMERADVLYGLTMQQQGISRMLTINLDEAERDFIDQE